MKDNSCRRLWQVEAARDGRLAGADLANALRHGERCAECKQAAQTLDQLGQRLKTLPVQPMPPLEQRRARQALLSAWNDQLLGEPRAKARPRALVIAALCAITGVALALGYPRLHGATRLSESPPEKRQARLGLESKSNQPAAAEPKLAVATANVAPSPVPPAPIKPEPSALAAKSRSAGSRREPALAAPALDTAEDNTYLEIVELLRSGRESEARAKASQYLVRFPRGFRRLEVESILRRAPRD
jgi:hypothetical protein